MNTTDDDKRLEFTKTHQNGNDLLVENEINRIEDDSLEISTIFVRKSKSKMLKNSLKIHDQYVKQRKRLSKCKKIVLYKCVKQQAKSNNILNFKEIDMYLKKLYSMPVFANLEDKRRKYYLTKNWMSIPKQSVRFKSDYIVNIFFESENFNSKRENSTFMSTLPVKPCWNVFRCQLNTQEESCCCSCNSDAMFEVMKSLYDCYKKKNCDNCNCILCGHLPREERRLGEMRKSGMDLALAKVDERKKKITKKKKIKSSIAIALEKIPSEKVKKIKAARLLTPLEGKSPEEKEELLRGLAMYGTPLPKGKTASDKKLIEKVRKNIGLPPGPKTSTDKKRYERAMASGFITPLEGKTATEKEKILRGQSDLGLPLPDGRTLSEKNLVDKLKIDRKEPSVLKIPSAKLRKAKEKGLLTPLEGKTDEQKEDIIKGLAMDGIPLPEAKSDSEKKIIDKVRAEIGLPPEPKTSSTKAKYKKALAAGLITPLERKTASEKEKILRGQANLGIALPVARTASEKNLIAKLKAEKREPSVLKIPSAKLRKAKEKGLLTPLEGKTDEQKEDIIKGLAMDGIPLPETKSDSEKKIIDKVRAEIGLPPEPKTSSTKAKYKKALAAGIIKPLEGKSDMQKENIIRKQAEMGVSLPEGRTASEKAMIAKIKAEIQEPSGILVVSDKIKKAKAMGFMTPLQGKTPEQKEIILKGLAMNGIPLPEAKTESEKRIINKVRKNVGLPPEPKSKKERSRYDKAVAEGLVIPLEGKTISEKELILEGQADLGLELPKGRSSSEKTLIKRVKTNDKRRKKLDAKTLKVLKEGKGPSDECICGLLSKEKAILPAHKTVSLKGKTPLQKEAIIRNLAKQGLPLPEAKTMSEKKILEKVQADLGLPPQPISPSLKGKYARAQKAGVITPLEGKSQPQKEKILVKQAKMGIPLPEGRTPSEKALINKIRTTIKPLDLVSEKLSKADVLTTLEGKSAEEKKKIIKNIIKAGLPWPEGKTLSEKQIIKNVKDEFGLPSKYSSEIFYKAKAAGLITPLEGKTKIQKEKILKARVAAGLPLPKSVSSSDKELIRKIKSSIGPSPKTSEKIIIAKSALHSKTPSQKEKILKSIAKQGLPLPEPRTLSDKAFIDKVRGEISKQKEKKSPSAKMRLAKAAGLLTPLEGKLPEQKEKILRGLVNAGIPMPEGKSNSEKKLIEKIRDDVGLPPQPKTSAMREKMNQAQLIGIITPLKGKTDKEKENILKNMHKAGIPLPRGTSSSEKSLIKKIKTDVYPTEAKHKMPPEILKKAKDAGLLTPLEGKTPMQKERILRGLDKFGIPLPERKSPSEKAIIKKILEEKIPEKLKKLDKKTAKKMKESKGPSDECICDLLKPISDEPHVGYPSLIKPDKLYKVDSEKLKKAKAAGLLTPLSDKTPEQKEKILKGLALQGIPLPKAKTASEKKIISKIRNDIGLPPEPKNSSLKVKYSKANAAGFLTPLQGKSTSQKEKILRGQAQMGLPLPEGRTPSERELIAKIKETTPLLPKEHIPSEKLRRDKVVLLTPLEGKSPEQKEKILKQLAMQGIPFPEAKTSSEKKLFEKVRTEVGLPPEPKTLSLKQKYDNALAAGLLTPLQGKSTGQKEKILRRQAQMGMPLPEGRTPSEKNLITKIKATTSLVPKEHMHPEKIRVLTPLEGKSPEQKGKILRQMAMQKMPLPDAKTESEKKLFEKVRADVGLPSEPKTTQEKEKYKKAIVDGIITPLEGKSPSQKEKILRNQAEMGLNLPQGRTLSEKALIDKIRKTIPLLPEKIAKSKAPSFLALEGKEKEEYLKALALKGFPLPEPKSVSEKKLIDKVRVEIGLPPVPKTASIKDKYDKAKALDVITPLQGKSASQKEKILRAQAKLGLPLPEGRTSSEKALISKIKKTTSVTKLESIKGKKFIPTLPPEKLAKLDKTTAKVMKEKKGPSDECICHILSSKIEKEPTLSAIKTSSKKFPDIYKIPSEKIRKAKETGLFTPLKGKSSPQKEKILKGLAMQGIPLPEGKTISENKLIDKIRADLGLPPEPTTQSAKQKYNAAIAAGHIGPLEGKSNKEKEQIFRKEAELGLTLPAGRTPSEKHLIDIIKQTARPPSDAVTISKKTKAAPSLKKFEGKTPDEKEKILRSLADARLPLPEGKTSSEKSLIRKIKTEYGIPPKAHTISEREIIKKAKAEGLLTPLKGKSRTQKEKILKGLAKSGLPMPEGATTSEKELVQKIRTLAGLSPEIRPSEKRGKIKTKSKRIGVGEAVLSARLVSKSKGGIVEEFQDVIKTTTCDKGCGCDKKKIRFKHSYVKIRVTSPDISSLCPCPEECVPGVKGGIFTDNEGIKVTVGRVTGVPSFSSRKSLKDDIEGKLFESTLKPIYASQSNTTIISGKESDNIASSSARARVIQKFINVNYTKSESKINVDSSYKRTIHLPKSYSSCLFNDNDNRSNHSNNKYTTKNNLSFTENYSKSNSITDFYINEMSQSTSFDSIILLNCDSTISLLTLPTSISVISLYTTTYSSNSSFYEKQDLFIHNIHKDKITARLQSVTNSSNDTRFCSSQVYGSISDIDAPVKSFSENIIKHDVHVFRIDKIKSRTSSLMYIINNNKSRIIESDKSTTALEIKKVLYQIISQKQSNKSSSLIIIMTTSSNEESSKYSLEGSTIVLDLFEKYCCWNYNANRLNHLRQNRKGFKITTKGRDIEGNRCVSKKENLFENNFCMKDYKNQNYRKIERNQISRRIISTDTTQDRPCCCKIHVSTRDINKKKVKSIVTELVTPIILKEAAAQGLSHEAFTNLPANEILNQSLSLSQSNLCMTSSVRVCKIPSCNGQARCHSHCPPKHKLQQIALNNDCSKNFIKTCDCSPEKIRELIDKQSKVMVSKACNISFEKNVAKISLPKEEPRKNKARCNSCDSSVYAEDKLKTKCPCEQHQKITIENEQISDNEAIDPTYNCKCKKQRSTKKKDKKVICECPEEPESEIDFHEWIDDKEIRKLKSDLTQTTSGFKINMPRKKYDPELEMSFEETLRYLAENLEKENKKFKKDCLCAKDVDCECPYESSSPQHQDQIPPEEEPFTGIKFHISGKGSGSKGLNGILCFDLLNKTSSP